MYDKQAIEFELILRKILKTDITAFLFANFQLVLSNYPLVPNTIRIQEAGQFRLSRVSRTNKKKGGQVSRTNNKKRISRNKNTHTKKNNNKKSRTK